MTGRSPVGKGERGSGRKRPGTAEESVGAAGEHRIKSEDWNSN